MAYVRKLSNKNQPSVINTTNYTPSYILHSYMYKCIYIYKHTYIIPVIFTVKEKTFGIADSNARIISIFRRKLTSQFNEKCVSCIKSLIVTFENYGFYQLESS